MVGYCFYFWGVIELCTGLREECPNAGSRVALCPVRTPAPVAAQPGSVCPAGTVRNAMGICLMGQKRSIKSIIRLNTGSFPGAGEDLGGTWGWDGSENTTLCLRRAKDEVTMEWSPFSGFPEGTSLLLQALPVLRGK